MSKIVSLLTAVFVFSFFGAVHVFTQTTDPLEEADRLYSEKKFAQAAAAYQTLVDKLPDDSTSAKMIFNLGMSYQKLKQYDRAIETFKRILVIKFHDRDANVYGAWDYRTHAQWEIGDILFTTGDYAGALAAYRTTREKYPFRCFCGTCLITTEIRYILYEAICLERLGRYDEAVKNYLKIYEPRLAELYYAAGQLDDLKAIVAKMDEARIAERMRKFPAWTREKASENLQSKYLNEAIAAYDLEKAENWTGLIKSAVRFAPLRGNGRRNVAVEALARHPKQVFPIIKQEVNKLSQFVQVTKQMLNESSNRVPVEIYYQILASINTDESIAFLKELAVKPQNYDGFAIVRTLDSAGEKGAAALKELEPVAKANLKSAIEWRKNGGLEAESDSGDIPFPALVFQGKLLTDL